MSPELVGSILTGLTGLLGGLAAFAATRNRRITEDRKVFRRQVRRLQKQLVAALDHIFDLEQGYARRGLPIPERPAILEMDDDDDEPAASAPPAASGTP